MNSRFDLLFAQQDQKPLVAAVRGSFRQAGQVKINSPLRPRRYESGPWKMVSQADGIQITADLW